MSDRVIEQRRFEEWFRTTPFFKQVGMEKPAWEAWIARASFKESSYKTSREILSELIVDPTRCEFCNKQLYEDTVHKCK